MTASRWAGALTLLFAAGSVSAQDAGPLDVLTRAGVSWSLRASYWSSDRELNAQDHFGATSLWLKAEGKPLPGVSYFAEGWGALRGRDGMRRYDDAELREAYVGLRAGNLDARIGRQIFAWGRADGINPTDRLSSNDYRFLAPEDDERRLGAGAARATYYANSFAVTALWLPEFRANRVSLPPSVSGAVEDRDRWNEQAWAVRVVQTGSVADWSLSYGSTLDATPDLVMRAMPGGPTLELAHHPIRFVGADAAMNVGRFGLRTEAAYLHTADRNGDDPSIKNREVFAVAGADRTYAGTVNVNVQYLFRYVLDFDESDEGAPQQVNPLAWQQNVLSNQTERVQHGASARVGWKLLHETLETELAGVAYFGPRGGVIRPKVSYAITDHIKVVAGSEHYGGADASVFGLLRANSAGFLELRLSY
ncbi:MAG TPA: DUF1302 family protein [Gemmatimonadaceae bacterium]|nr:DUF1302 family protein [Gemmatimonadaceae bacterium]